MATPRPATRFSAKQQQRLEGCSRIPLATRIAALTIVACSALPSESDAATTYVRTAGSNGAYGDTSLYSPSGVLPVAGDTVTSDGTGTIIDFTAANDGSALATLSLNVTSGATTFNQSAGAFSLNTLNFGGAGGSRNPIYNFTGGTLNIATAFTWGNGSAAAFNVAGGTVNYGGIGLSLGVASGAKGTINISSGIFNANSLTSFNLGNTGNATGTLALSGTGIFNATAITQINLANNANVAGTAGTITLADTAQFNAPAANLSVGQFGSNAAGVGTLTIGDAATLTTALVTIGGNNATNAGYGIVNLNGGTVTTGSMRLGIGASGTPSATRNAINANGGTVVAATNANNSDFFAGAFVNAAAGGLKFNTNGNAVTITNAISGVGGLTKQGPGTLTLTGASTFAGDTTISAGTVLVSGSLSSSVTAVSGTLGGAGGTVGATTVHAGGTLAPGAASIGTLNFSSTLTLAGSATFEINKTGLTLGADLANVTGALTLGGNLTIVASGDALTVGDTFNLFDAASFSGSFASVNLPALDPGLSWNTSQLTTNGSIAVVPEPASIATLLGGLGALVGLQRLRRRA